MGYPKMTPKSTPAFTKRRSIGWDTCSACRSAAIRNACSTSRSVTWPTPPSPCPAPARATACSRSVPNIVSALPGIDAAASKMMKNLIKKKGVASIPELRELAVDADVRMIACQMTLDLFEYSQEDMIEGVEIGGAATYIEVATQSHINLFI